MGIHLLSSCQGASATARVSIHLPHDPRRLVLLRRPKNKIACSRGRIVGASAPALPPGPVPWPVVGNLPEMLLSKPAFRWIHRMMEDMGTDITCVRLGSVHVIAILPQHRPRAAGTRTPCSRPSATPRAHLRRSSARPATRWLHDRRADEADNLSRYVHTLATGSASGVDVRHVARHYCGNVIRRLVFGRRYFGEPRPDGGPGLMEEEHMDAVFTSLGLLFAFCVSDYLPWLRGLDLDGHEKAVKEANTTVNRLHDTVIDERWRQWKSGERRELDDFLDVLITLKDAQGKPALTIEEDIILAATDNPSNAVEWALAEMANAPEVMAKAVEEMDRVVGRERLVQESDIPQLNYAKACIREAFRLHPEYTGERLVQESDIPQLNYAKACIREAFRLHPVAPFNLPHVALDDTTVAGYHVPKGSHVILSRIGLGRNPVIWEEPLLFKPERHINMAEGGDVVLTENELRFISFSTGRRGCIASSLGTDMCMMLFGRLIQGFTWSKPQGVAAINLSESEHDLFLTKPLVLHAEPRLPVHLYSATDI
uniref:Tyrosine N-monooxygenase n=1 Tax=Aegilops tauschii TaxID=37682 RepID=R7W0S5_AEGTA